MYSWDQLYYNILLLVFIRPLLSFYISFRLFGPALAFLSSFRSSLPSSVQGYRSAPLSRSPSLSLSFSLTRAQVFVSVVIMWRGSTKPLQAVFLLDVWVRTRSIFRWFRYFWPIGLIRTFFFSCLLPFLLLCGFFLQVIFPNVSAILLT